MISKEIVSYSLRNLWSRKGRSFLTLLSIFVGIATIFIFLSFGLGLFNYIDEVTHSGTADKVIIQPKGTGPVGLDDTFSLTDDDLRTIKRVTGVYEAEGMSMKVAKINQREEIKYVFLAAYNPSNPLVMEMFNVDLFKGRQLKSGDESGVVLGYNYLFDKKIMSKKYELNDNIEIQGEKLRVVGFMEEVGNPQDDSNVYVSLDLKKELYEENETNYNMAIARVDIDNIERVVERIEDELRKGRGLEKGEEEFFAQSYEELIDSYSNILNIVIGFIILIALISVLVSAVNTANTMITSVLERIKEIGVLKSIGSKNSEIFKLFLFESSFLGLIAGIIGVIIGASFSFVAGIILNNLGWGFLSPSFNPGIFIGCILFAILTGTVSGVAPAINASKINIVDALRYE